MLWDMMAAAVNLLKTILEDFLNINISVILFAIKAAVTIRNIIYLMESAALKAEIVSTCNVRKSH